MKLCDQRPALAILDAPAALPLLMKTFLSVPDEDTALAVSLGALRDGASGQLYVPRGTALAPFRGWMPAAAGADLMIPHEKGLSLTALLQRVSNAIRTAFDEPVWVRLEVNKVGMHGGSLYIEGVERDPAGDQLAKASAVIWSGRVTAIMRKFQEETGIELAAGIKLLVLARPEFKPKHGLNLVVTDIDASYSIGAMAAKLKRIREKLAADGFADLNRKRVTPEDYFHVAVIAPADAAGRGDFKAEADRLEAAGLCRFSYFDAVFQGERAKESIKEAFVTAFQAHARNPFDALAFIRGGGATSDLQWLNEYVLAAMVCRFPAPVFVGVGHERDKTVLDEYAHQSFGTPSKVIAYIRQTIVSRALKAHESWSLIVATARSRLTVGETRAQAAHMQVTQRALRAVDRGDHKTDEAMRYVMTGAGARLDRADTQAENLHASIGERVASAIDAVELAVDIANESIGANAMRLVDLAGTLAAQEWRAIETSAKQRVSGAVADVDRHLEDVTFFARRVLTDTEEHVEDLMAGILAHSIGPTLKRGFAIVKAAGGAPVSSKAAAEQHDTLTIQFRDGDVPVHRSKDHG